MLIAFGIAAAASLVATPATSFADLCRAFMPDHVADMRGYTFTGTVVKADHPQRRPEIGPTTYTFAIDHVFATKDDPVSNPPGLVLKDGGRVSLYGESCDGIRHLAVGSRYLFSTSYLPSPTGPETVAWLLNGDRAQLVRMFPTLRAQALARATTLDSALALAAPGSPLPPTDTATGISGSGLPLGVVLLIAAIVGMRFDPRRVAHAREMADRLGRG